MEKGGISTIYLFPVLQLCGMKNNFMCCVLWFGDSRVEQSSPVKPLGHWHTASSPCAEQDPEPQGFGSQGSAEADSTEQETLL